MDKQSIANSPTSPRKRVGLKVKVLGGDNMQTFADAKMNPKSPAKIREALTKRFSIHRARSVVPAFMKPRVIEQRYHP